jgi:hypothetical protein
MWSMERFQVKSIEDPFRSDPELAEEALRLVSRAEYLGCLPDLSLPVLNASAVASISKCMQDADLPVTPRVLLLLESGGRHTSDEWHLALASLNHQLEMSPLPGGEWSPVASTLDEELLGRLLRVSPSSIRRYQTGGRPTPQGVAERLHFVALLLADLAGSYNDFGIRRWFNRPRAALGGQRPVEMIEKDAFDPDGDDGEALRKLALSLTSAGAA